MNNHLRTLNVLKDSESVIQQMERILKEKIAKLGKNSENLHVFI